jgi:hypothetical protein
MNSGFFELMIGVAITVAVIHFIGLPTVTMIVVPIAILFVIYHIIKG